MVRLQNLKITDANIKRLRVFFSHDITIIHVLPKRYL